MLAVFSIQWLQDSFMTWLDEWDRSVESRDDLSLSEKDRRCLSRETLDGLRFTGSYAGALIGA